jgi:hypothetical protein
LFEQRRSRAIHAAQEHNGGVGDGRVRPFGRKRSAYTLELRFSGKSVVGLHTRAREPVRLGEVCPCFVEAAAVVERLAERKMHAFAGAARQIGSLFEPEQTLDDRIVTALDSPQMGEPDERSVVLRIDREQTLERRNRGCSIAVLLVPKREVVERGRPSRIERKRCLERGARLIVAVELGAQHADVRPCFFGIRQPERHRALVHRERLVVVSVAAQATGEVVMRECIARFVRHLSRIELRQLCIPPEPVQHCRKRVIRIVGRRELDHAR